jgi:hypothetical protein
MPGTASPIFPSPCPRWAGSASTLTGNLSRRSVRVIEAQASAVRLPPRDPGDLRRERLTEDQLQDQESDAVGFFEPVDCADVGVIQRGEHPCFALRSWRTIAAV